MFLFKCSNSISAFQISNQSKAVRAESVKGHQVYFLFLRERLGSWKPLPFFFTLQGIFFGGGAHWFGLSHVEGQLPGGWRGIVVEVWGGVCIMCGVSGQLSTG